jgi:hypothetical protein
MPISDNAKIYFRGITFALLGVIAAVLGITGVGFFGDYFTVHPFFATIAVSDLLGIDLFGAVAPLIAATISIALFVKAARFPMRKFAVAFLVSVALAFLLSHPTSDGVEGFPLLYALLVGAAAVAVNGFPKFSVDYKKNLPTSLMLGLACIPISLFTVDLVYSQSFTGSVIGGNGLADGLMVSTLYAPLGVTVAFSGFAYVSQTVWIVGKSRGGASMQLQSGINTRTSGDKKIS